MVTRRGVPAYMQIADAIRAQIRDNELQPGAQLPTEREMMQTWGVSSRTIRVALDQLRAEGLISSKQGRGVFVREQVVPRRLSTDIAVFEGWYTMLARQGLKPAGGTTVRTASCPPEAAEWLGIAPGDDVVIRERDMGTEGEPPVMIATSYFPRWVVEAAPNLADPKVSGMPKWLREAFGDFYSEDVLTTRMPTPQEQERLDLPPGTPVQIIKGGSYDQENRPLHFIEVIAAGGRIEFAYRYGPTPDATEDE
jgi:GntR family transcriptional regulator